MLRASPRSKMGLMRDSLTLFTTFCGTLQVNRATYALPPGSIAAGYGSLGPEIEYS